MSSPKTHREGGNPPSLTVVLAALIWRLKNPPDPRFRGPSYSEIASLLGSNRSTLDRIRQDAATGEPHVPMDNTFLSACRAAEVQPYSTEILQIVAEYEEAKRTGPHPKKKP